MLGLEGGGCAGTEGLTAERREVMLTLMGLFVGSDLKTQEQQGLNCLGDGINKFGTSALIRMTDGSVFAK